VLGLPHSNEVPLAASLRLEKHVPCISFTAAIPGVSNRRTPHCPLQHPPCCWHTCSTMVNMLTERCRLLTAVLDRVYCRRCGVCVLCCHFSRRSIVRAGRFVNSGCLTAGAW